MIDQFLNYLRDLIIAYFKNMYNKSRIIRNADTIETDERRRGKEGYITRYTI